MTKVLTIPTPFTDFSELTENFAQRVDEERLMLPCPTTVQEGEWVHFSVLLGDGDVALSGIGRVQGSFDNGEEHPPEYRFDVVLDSLQFEGMHEVMFERLLMARSSVMGAEPVTGEVSIAELEESASHEADQSPALMETDDTSGEEVHSSAFGATMAGEQAPSAIEPEDDAVSHAPESVSPPSDGSSAVGDAAESFANDAHFSEAEADDVSSEDHFDGDSVEAAARLEAQVPTIEAQAPRVEREQTPVRAAKEAARPVKAAAYPTRAHERGQLPSPHSFSGIVLTRAALPAAWTPTPNERPPAAQSSGLFDYNGPVPSPTHPPRPELHESQRVRPAPRPGAPWARTTAQRAAVLSEPPLEMLDGDASPMMAEQITPAPTAEREEW